MPDLTKKRLALSGLVVASSPEQNAASAAKTESSEVNLSPAVRHFPRGGILDYGSAIYNAQLDSTGKPNLMMQIEVYKDGQSVFQSQPRPVDAKIIDGRVECSGRLTLATLPPGDYALHLIVTDTQAKSKYARADQWMDFGIR